jgi:cell division protein FtsQ
VDPRIQRRRVEVTRQAGRRRLRIVLAAVAGFGLAGLGYVATRMPVLDVDHIRVTGTGGRHAVTAAEAGGLYRGMAMVDVVPKRAERRIERLAWVASAEVSRRWPGTLVVTVHERLPAAAIARPDGHWAVADLTGQILGIAQQPPAGLPHVHGENRLTASGRIVAPDTLVAVKVGAALPLELRREVGGINLTPTGIELGLTHGHGVVRLGDGTDLEEKLRSAATVLGRVAAAKVAVLDVRVARAPVLTRR